MGRMHFKILKTTTVLVQYIHNFIHFFHWPFRKVFTQLQFRYLACGGFMFLFDLAVVWFVYYIVLKDITQVYLTKTYWISAYSAALWSPFPFSLLLSYTLSRFIVFHETTVKQKTSIVRYIALVGSCIYVSFLLLTFFIAKLHWNIMLARVVTNILIAFYSYAIQKFFAFKITKPKPREVEAPSGSSEGS